VQADEWLEKRLALVRQDFDQRFPRLGLTKDVPRAYPKRPNAAARNWEINLVRDMLDSPALLDCTAGGLASYVNKQLEGWSTSSRDIDRPFKVPHQTNLTVKGISRLLSSRGKNLDVAKCNTINKIKKALRHYGEDALAGAAVTLIISHTADAIFKDGKRYKRHSAGPGKTRIRHGDGHIPAELIIDWINNG
jgi:hypothetical protein